MIILGLENRRKNTIYHTQGLKSPEERKTMVRGDEQKVGINIYTQPYVKIDNQQRSTVTPQGNLFNNLQQPMWEKNLCIL